MSIEDCTLSTLNVEGELVISFSAPDIAPRLTSTISKNLGIITNLVSIEAHVFKLDVLSAKLGRELFPEPVVCKSIITQIGEITPIPWRDVSITCVSEIPAVADNKFIVYPAIFLGNEQFPAFVFSSATVTTNKPLNLVPLFFGETAIAATANADIALLNVLLPGGTSDAGLTLNTPMLRLDPIAIEASTVPGKATTAVSEFGFTGDFSFSAPNIICKAVAFAGIPRLVPLNLQNAPTVVTKNIVDEAECRVIRTIVLDSGTSTSISQTFAELAGSLTDIDYPQAIHDQVRYPLPTATSFATPLLNDVPIHYAHSAFGAALTVVSQQANTSASLSAALRGTVQVPASDSYAPESIDLDGTIVMFRVSNQDTTTTRSSAVGYTPFGADVTRLAPNIDNLPLTYTGSVTGMGTGGTTALASGSAITDSRSIVNTSPNKRLLIASSLIRHNFNTADSTTVPISAATDFNYPATNTTRLTRARLETTVAANDEAGLSAAYSTNHLALISDSEFSARNSNGASFSFNQASVNVFGNSTTATQHVHSSDSMFAFLPIKAGVRYQFNKHFTSIGNIYTVTSAEFLSTANGLKFCVALDPEVGTDFTLPLSLRVQIVNYRNDRNRTVTVDIPVTEYYEDKLVIDSSYRWFVQQVVPGGQFANNSVVTLGVDNISSGWSLGNSALIATRPNIGTLPVNESGGGDQGEFSQNLLSLSGDRNFLLGEFSISAKRQTTDTVADVRISTGPDANNYETTYTVNATNKPAESVAAFAPRILQLIIDSEGNLKGQLEQYENGELVTKPNIMPILPTAVRVFIAGGGKFSKVVVGEHAIGLLSTPTSGTSGRKLFVWGSGIYGHSIPPAALIAYSDFAKNGYIDNIKDFDIHTAYMCAVTDAGILHCWGCTAAASAPNTDRSAWINTNGAVDSPYVDAAIGGQHMVLKLRSNSGGISIKQYGSLSVNPPFYDGWSTGTENTVACGLAHVVALRADGTVVCWGDNTEGQCTVPGGLNNIIAVAAGDNHSVALKNDGTIYAWGKNHKGQLDLKDQTGLKAKAIFAAGNYSGCIRRNDSTDITATDANYSDVEDTVFITGDNEHFVKAVPLCEGKSYDISYPRYRMKFHKVIAGWDHVIGIRKVEEAQAFIIHPELCRFINSSKIPIKFKNNGQDIFNLQRVKQRAQFPTESPELLFVNSSDAYYHPGVDGTQTNGVNYRLRWDMNASCVEITVQRKEVNGQWADVNFNAQYYGVYGNLQFSKSLTDVTNLTPLWFTAANALPEWKIGISGDYSCQGASQVVFNAIATGETLTLDFTDADKYGDCATDGAIVCWGNPLGYYVGYRRDSYAEYGISEFSSNTTAEDLDHVETKINHNKVLQFFARATGLGTFGNTDIEDNTHSYLGYLDLAKKFSSGSNGELAPLKVDGSDYDFYLGPNTAYLIPVGQAFDVNWTPLIVRSSALTNSNPETAIINCPLPTSGYSAGTPKLNAYFVTNAPIDANSTYNRFGVTQGVFKTLNATSISSLDATYNASNKWVVLADSDNAITSYGWGSSPTGYWYVYNNTISTVTTGGLVNRYYNLTGMYVVMPTGATPDENDSEIHLPFDSSVYLTPTAYKAIGLDVRRFYIAKNQTNLRWAMEQRESPVPEPLLPVKAGKHLSLLPTAAILSTHPSAVFRRYNSGYYGVSLKPEYAGLGYIPGSFFSDSYMIAAGYRSAYRAIAPGATPSLISGVAPSIPPLGISPNQFRYLINTSIGDNSYGQLNTLETYSAFYGNDPIGRASTGSGSLPQVGINWLMSVGQLSAPSAQGGQTFTSVSCAKYHALALDTRGKIYAWGSNYRMQPVLKRGEDWNPAVQPTDSACSDLGYRSLFYTATKDIFNELGNTNWLDNNVPSAAAGGVPSSLIPVANGVLLPYPAVARINNPAIVDPLGTLHATGFTLFSLNGFSNLEFTQNNTLRNGGFNVSVVYGEDNTARLKTSAGLNGPAIFSDPFSIDGARLLSCSYSYNPSSKLTISGAVNSKPITWEGELSSGQISVRNPMTAMEIVGNAPQVAPIDLNDVPRVDSEANKLVVGAIAGKNKAHLIIKDSVNISDVLYPTNRLNSESPEEGFEEIGLGSYQETFDIPLKKVLRRFTITDGGTATRALIVQPLITGLTVPQNIASIPDATISSSTLAELKHVISIAAGRNVMFAIVGDDDSALTGSIVKWGSVDTVVPPGTDWRYIASSHSQVSGAAWSHAAAIDSTDNLKIWGVDPYWNTTTPSGVYLTATCTNDAVIAILKNGGIEVFTQNLNMVLPEHLVNVKFKSVSGGENHVVAVVKDPITVTTNNGDFVLNANDVVAWGDNSNGQCDIPGYAYGLPTNLPVQSEHVAAGVNFSVYYRFVEGLVLKNIPTTGDRALSFNNRGQRLVPEGFMVHSLGYVCADIFAENHPYYFNRPVESLCGQSINVANAHKTITAWTTGALDVPTEFKPTSNSLKRAKLIHADKFSNLLRPSDSPSGEDRPEFMWGAGVNAFVEEGGTDIIHVFGGEQKYTPPGAPFCSNRITYGYIAARQIPTLLPNTQIYSLHGRNGYFYALDNLGIVHNWGWQSNNSPIAANPIKKFLSVPKAPNIDSTFGNNNPSYVLGVPGLAESWAVEVSLNRYFNGNKTTLKRFAATGATNKVSIDSGVHFAETFMALDTWPAASTGTSLDTYYALDIKTAGGAVQYKINSASLLALNLDSRINLAGTRALIEAAPNNSVLPDFAIVTANTKTAGTNPINTGSVGFSSATISPNNGVTLNYVDPPVYPSYLRNQYGASARIEFVNPTDQTLFTQGNIAATDSSINWLNPDYYWNHTGIVPSSSTNGTTITDWNGAFGNLKLVPTNNPTIANPFIASPSSRAARLIGTTTASASYFTALTSNVNDTAFTYFIVKKNAASSATSSKHSVFVARWAESNAVRLRGIGEVSRKPAIIYYDSTQQQIRFHETATATNTAPQIIAAYFGGISDYGIHVNGAIQTLHSSTTTVAANAAFEAPGYYLGAANISISGVPTLRDANTEVADILVFNRRLTLTEIQFVEGYLAWTYGLQANLPSDHPHKSAIPQRKVLASLQPFDYDEPPLTHIDIGLAAQSKAEAWLTLYDVHAEYSNKRTNAAGDVVRDNHAPIVAELVLDQRSTIGLIGTNAACKLNVSANGELEVDGLTYLQTTPISNISLAINEPDTFEVLTETTLNTTVIAAKLNVNAELLLQPLDLQQSVVFGKLKFMAGANCDGPYGCTDIVDEPPSLQVIPASRYFLAAPVFTKLSSNSLVPGGFGVILSPARYLLVNTLLTTNTPNLNIFGVLAGTAQSKLTVNTPSLFDNSGLLARSNQIAINCELKAIICDSPGLVIVRPKITRTAAPLFPIDISRNDINRFSV